MKLIDAIKFYSLINEGTEQENLANLITNLEKLNGINDKQYTRINHIIDTADETVKSLMENIAEAGITENNNADIYDYLLTKIENNNLWYSVFNKVFGKDNKGVIYRNKVGITTADFKENEPFNAIDMVKQKYGFNDDVNSVLSSLITYSSGGTKMPQGSSELFFSLFSKNGRFVKRGKGGDVIIGKPGNASEENTSIIELKCTTIQKTEAWLISQKPMKPQNKIADEIRAAMEKYFALLKKINPKYKASLFNVTSNTFKSPTNSIDHRILKEARTAFIKKHEEKIKTALINVYKKVYCAPFVDAKQYRPINKIINKSLNKSSLQEIIERKYILSPSDRNEMLRLWAAFYLEFYQNQKGFNGILVGKIDKSGKRNKFVYLSAETINGETQPLINVLKNNEIKFTWPRPDSQSRGVAVGVCLK